MFAPRTNFCGAFGCGSAALCNLDLGTVWHNVHPHSARWQLPSPSGGATDVHALSPAQTYVMDTEAPPAIRVPCALEPLQCDPPLSGCRIPVKGEFLVHCHLEEHMMSGLAGLVRSKDWIWVSQETLAATDILLPYDDGTNEVGWVDLMRCGHHCPTGKHPRPPTPEPAPPIAITHRTMITQWNRKPTLYQRCR